MKRNQRRLVRIIAIVLAVLLAGSALVSAVFSMAYGEEAAPARNQYALKMEYLANEQALRVSQRLVYTNVSNVHLDRVIFYAPANMLRRQTALMYSGDELLQAFPSGYVPGGIELSSVLLNGEKTDWGFQGESETCLRVACDLSPGESCEFNFDYFLLMTQNSAFLGLNETDWRLSDFYFVPACVDDSRGEFILNPSLPFTEYIETAAADFSAEITLPKSCLLVSAGQETSATDENGNTAWIITAENTLDFTMSFGQNRKESISETTSGTKIRCISKDKGAARRVLALAEETLAACEAWFGPLPGGSLDFVQSGIARDFLAHSGVVWLSEDLFSRKNAGALAHAVRFGVAKQYFGMSARARVSSDAWLSDSVCEYLSFLLLEEAEGHDAYLKALNDELVASLQLTIPGGLVVTSDASLFEPYEYEIVILDRGAAVFHELRTAMGRDEIISGFARFHSMGLEKEILTEMDLVSAMDEASGAHWEKFLTDWVFNIGDYVNQTIEWLD